jgi:hypothetical protein
VGGAGVGGGEGEILEAVASVAKVGLHC